MPAGLHIPGFSASCSSARCSCSASTSPSSIAELRHRFDHRWIVAEIRIDRDRQGWHARARRTRDRVGEQAAPNEMWTAQPLLHGHHYGDAAIGLGQDWPPVLGASPGDDGGDRSLARRRVATVVDEFGRESDRRGKRLPELLLQRSTGDELAVLGWIQLITRRTTGE